MMCPHCGHDLTLGRPPLTSRQAQIVAFIRSHVAERGCAPTFEEIAIACDLRALSTVSEHIKNLCRKGYIIQSHNAKQGITLVDTPSGVTT